MKALSSASGTELDSALGTGARRRPRKLPALHPIAGESTSPTFLPEGTDCTGVRYGGGKQAG